MNKAAVIIPTFVVIFLVIVAGIVVFFLVRVEKEDFSFRILDKADGTPIEDVEIKVIEKLYDYGYNNIQFSNDYQPTKEKLKKTFFTNEEGWANISLPKIARGDGYYVFMFSKKGYLPQSGSSIFMGDTATDAWPSGDDPCSVAFYSSTNLSGVVKDRSGAPVEGITVSVRFHNWETDNFDVTGPDGRYELKNIRAGETNLTISGPGIISNFTTIDLWKFQDNIYDPVVNRTNETFYSVRITPSLSFEDEPVSVSDGELAMLFVRTHGNYYFEYCWGAVPLKDGEFDLSVQPGSYELKWYYLGDEDYIRVDLPLIKDGYPSNELSVRSNIDIQIDIDLDPMIVVV